MIELETIRVLLVEDDEDDCFLVKELLREIKGREYAMDWARNYDQGLSLMSGNKHDVCLVDYRLGAQNGVDLLKAAQAMGCTAPVIILTGMGQAEVDLAAMRAGASDYLIKGRIDSNQLERSIRYAVERNRAAARAAFEHARLAAFGSQIGLALMQRAALPEILDRCARAMVQYLNAALAQVWIYDAAQKVLEPRASAGPVFDKVKSPHNLPVPLMNLEDLAAGRPVLVRSLADGGQLSTQAWACQQQLTAFAALPLLLEDRLVGMLSLYSREPLTETVLQEMNSVANGIALCIQRKQAEEALDASEGRYRSVVANIKEVIFQMNEFGYWTFLNPAWATITGFAIKDALGTFYLDYLHHDDREQGRYIFLQLISRKIDFCRYETRLLTKDGKVRWVELYMQLTLDNDGMVLGASGSINDITERREAEEQAQKLAAFPRVNPNPVLEFSAEGALSYANGAALELARSLGREQVQDILPADVTGIVRTCLAEGSKRLREEVCLNGHTLTWSFFPVSAGRVVHCYGADITEMLNLEAQFRHAQKLESVGQMAAGIAHDFNNILTVIQGYADCLQSQYADDKSLATPLKRISEASRRAAALTRQLLMFSRKQAIQARSLDLNCVLQNLSNMLTRLLGEDIVVENHYASGLPQIQADTGMLEQVVMNLAVNARDAMPTGGKLVVTTETVQVDEDYAHHRAEARPGRFVCLSVQDTGCGMDEKTLGRIFEPFFSTKEVGRGTGLGLSTVYGIVKQHQGWVEVASTVGVGTTFKVFFPAAGAPQDPVTEEKDLRPVRGGPETILHVEDEPALRQLVRDILSQYQYRIIEASSGVEALKVWDEHDGRVDLLLTDMVMPEGLTGRELAQQLRKRKPDLRVIYTSGYTLKTFGNEQSESDTVWLEKPYQPSQLARTIRECLEAPPAGYHERPAPSAQSVVADPSLVASARGAPLEAAV
jgi:two-component system cell cycle sensor histidine kinase/response regulator CckA